MTLGRMPKDTGFRYFTNSSIRELSMINPETDLPDEVVESDNGTSNI